MRFATWPINTEFEKKWRLGSDEFLVFYQNLHFTEKEHQLFHRFISHFVIILIVKDSNVLLYVTHHGKILSLLPLQLHHSRQSHIAMPVTIITVRVTPPSLPRRNYFHDPLPVLDSRIKQILLGSS